MKPYGNFDVYILQSTVYVEPQDEEADVEGAWEACKSIFGVNSICRCRPCEKTMDAIFSPPPLNGSAITGIPAFIPPTG